MSLDLTGLGSVADFAKGIVDRFFPPSASEQEKMAASVELQRMIEARDSQRLETQKAVIVAEMEQGDNYTKRARPTIVYFGLFAIGLVHVVFPMLCWLVILAKGSPLTTTPPEITLPAEFWYTWGGVCSVWVIGRTAEKAGARGKIVSAITGIN